MVCGFVYQDKNTWKKKRKFSLAKPMDCRAPRMDSYVNYGHWIRTMCQCRLLGIKKCTTPIWNTNNGGGYAYMRIEGKWELYFLSILLWTYQIVLKMLIEKFFLEITVSVCLWVNFVKMF